MASIAEVDCLAESVKGMVFTIAADSTFALEFSPSFFKVSIIAASSSLLLVDKDSGDKDVSCVTLIEFMRVVLEPNVSSNKFLSPVRVSIGVGTMEGDISGIGSLLVLDVLSSVE